MSFCAQLHSFGWFHAPENRKYITKKSLTPKNLVSVSQFDNAGYYSTFGGGEVEITEGKAGEMILSGRGSVGMYVLESNTTYANLSTANPTTLENWHRRMAHVSPAVIEEMRTKKLVDGLDITDHNLDSKCLSCRAGRQHTHPYDSHTDTNVPPLHLVVFDLWGLSRVASPGGNTYMMVIVDSGTTQKHTAYLQDKSDESTIPVFEEYRVKAETQMGRKVKRVCTDNAFNSAKWREYFKTHGIIHETTALYSSPENGLAERAI
jgi:hypothetical protein